MRLAHIRAFKHLVVPETQPDRFDDLVTAYVNALNEGPQHLIPLHPLENVVGPTWAKTHGVA